MVSPVVSPAMSSSSTLESSLRSAVVSPTSAEFTAPALRPGRLRLGVTYSGVTSHVNSPSEFWLQVEGNELNELTEQMNEVYCARSGTSLNVVGVVQVNRLCALFGEDENWKRVLVTVANEESDSASNKVPVATVRLIDYGCSKMVPSSSLFPLEDTFHQQTGLAIPCSFRWVKPRAGSEEWSTSATTCFKSLVDCKLFNFTVTDISESGLHSIEFMKMENDLGCITSDGIASTLVIAKLAEFDRLRTQIPSSITPSLIPVCTHEIKPKPNLCLKNVNASPILETTPTTTTTTFRATFEPNVTATSQLITRVTSHPSSEQPIPAKISFPVASVRQGLDDSFVVSDCLADSIDTGSSCDASSEETQFPNAPAVNAGKTQRRKRRATTASADCVSPVQLPVAPTSGSATAKPSTSGPMAARFTVPHSAESFAVTISQPAVIAHAWTPDEFYVYPITEEASTLDLFSAKLNKVYERPGLPPIFMDSTDIALGSYWCARFPVDNCWYRAKVLNVKNVLCAVSPNDIAATDSQKKKKGKKAKSAQSYFRSWPVHVLYVDYGDKAWITSADLRLLKEEFCKTKAYAVNCSLAFVTPKPSNTLESAEWCEEAITKLREVTRSKPFTIQRVEEEKQDPISVLLWDLRGSSTQILLNEDFVNAGFGISNHFGEKSTSESSSSSTALSAVNNGDSQMAFRPVTGTSTSPTDEMATWDPMADDFNSLANSYNVDCDDAGVAITGYKARDEASICMFFQRKQSCPRGEMCQFRHITPAMDGSTTDQKEIWTNKEPVEIPPVGRLVHIEVCVICDPGNFYANFPKSTPSNAGSPIPAEGDRDKDLLTFQRELQKFYKHRSRRLGDNLLRSKGEIVVAKFSIDGQWYRGRVLDARRDQEICHVFFVDYGNTEWVRECDILDIVPQFIHLPYQAVQCFLARVKKHNQDETWSKNAITFFNRLVFNKPLEARVQLREGLRVGVDLYSVDGGSRMDISRALLNACLADECRIRSDSGTDSSKRSKEPFIGPA